MASLSEIASLPASSRGSAYSALLDAGIASRDGASLARAVDALADEAVPLSLSRPALRHLGDALRTCAEASLVEAACTHALSRLSARVSAGAFDDADFALRFPLYTVYASEGDHLRAAATLGAARLDSSALDDATRAAACVKVAQQYVKGGDEVAADRFLKKASESVYRVGDFALLLQFKSLYAVLLDTKRRFLEAALRYLEVLADGGERVDDEEAVSFLDKAAVCGVLAPAGPQRSRLLATLLRDERIGAIRPVVGAMLARVGRAGLVPPAEAAAFEAALEPHQRAQTADGTSVVARALVEHNTHAAARLYTSLSFGRLAELLGVTPAAAEAAAARMIGERRLAASLDQVGGFVDFELQAEAPAAGRGGVPAAAAATQRHPADGGRRALLEAHMGAWDAAIKSTCAGLAAVAHEIGERHPELKGGV